MYTSAAETHADVERKTIQQHMLRRKVVQKKTKKQFFGRMTKNNVEAAKNDATLRAGERREERSRKEAKKLSFEKAKRGGQRHPSWPKKGQGPTARAEKARFY